MVVGSVSLMIMNENCFKITFFSDKMGGELYVRVYVSTSLTSKTSLSIRFLHWRKERKGRVDSEMESCFFESRVGRILLFSGENRVHQGKWRIIK